MLILRVKCPHSLGCGFLEILAEYVVPTQSQVRYSGFLPSLLAGVLLTYNTFI